MRRFLGLAVAVVVAVALLGEGHSAEAAPTPNAGGPYDGTAGRQIEFNAVNSINAVSWQWDFGDGTRGSGIRVTKTYTQGGVFTVTLTATDEFGVSAVARTTATIRSTDVFSSLVTGGFPFLTTTSLPFVGSNCAVVVVNGIPVCSNQVSPFVSPFVGSTCVPIVVNGVVVCSGSQFGFTTTNPFGFTNCIFVNGVCIRR